MNLPFITIDYDQVSQDSYRAIVLYLPGLDQPLRFGTGNPPDDHCAALRRYFAWLAESGVLPGDGPLMESSTMTHFAFDGDRWVYRESPLEDVPLAGGMVGTLELELLVEA